MFVQSNQVLKINNKEWIEITRRTTEWIQKGRNVQDHIFTMKQIIEKSLQRKRKVYVGFIALERAFNKVPRLKL